MTDKDDIEKKVSLLLTPDQAKTISAACDFYSRVLMARFNEVGQVIRFGLIKKSGGSDLSASDFDRIDRHLRDVKHILGFADGGGHSIGSKLVDPSAHSAWEVKKVIDQCLAYDRDPNPKFKGVDYDGLSLRYAKGDAPECKIVFKI